MQIGFVLLFSLFALVNWTLPANAADSHPSEQTDFSVEDETVNKPVTIPEDVLATLKKDDLVTSEIENNPDEKMSRSWFSASAIHLSTGNRADLIVVAEPPIAGANVSMFWVFRSTARGHILVLETGGHDLAVKRGSSQGYRDIETFSVTMQMFTSILYKFDGKTYNKYRETH